MIHLNLIISQRPHLQIPSHWGLGLQHEGTLEEHKHSARITSAEKYIFPEFFL